MINFADHSINCPDSTSQFLPSRRVLYTNSGKILFDIAFVLCTAVIVLPVVLLLAVLVKRDGGSAFFGHTRVGKNGKIFKCWKIRTMIPNAEERLKVFLEENPNAKEQWQREFKLDDDPRVTRIGALLRRTSLDELPQFFNVLRGEMSVVGPRPVTQCEITHYGKRSAAILALRPGVTGTWQVSGRNEISYKDRVNIDERYVHTYSFLGDLFVIFKTIGSVLFRTGK